MKEIRKKPKLQPALRAIRINSLSALLCLIGTNSWAEKIEACGAENSKSSGMVSPDGIQKCKPLWELGLGLASLKMPAYRGSRENTGYVLPMPYFVYNGQFLKADKDGMRAQLSATDAIKFSVSVSAAAPVSSKKIEARAGMSDLKPAFEIGPQLDLTLWKNAANKSQLRLQIPVRTTYTLERKSHHIGWKSHPQLNWDLGQSLLKTDWSMGLMTGPVFSDRHLQNYYYGVSANEENSSRSQYQAPSGYSGWTSTFGVSKRFPKYWVGAFARHDYLSGASFSQSPLLTDKQTWTFGLAFSWVFATSSQNVWVTE